MIPGTNDGNQIGHMLISTSYKDTDADADHILVRNKSEFISSE